VPLSRERNSSSRAILSAISPGAPPTSTTIARSSGVGRRFLKRRELAVQQGSRHEVFVTGGHAPGDEVRRSFEIDQRHFDPIADDDVAIGPF